jgi:multimeric flavodoxin WrbA
VIYTRYYKGDGNMKCLVIHGSPRIGNTWNVLTLVKEEMKKSLDIDFTDIELRKENLPLCIGCFNCIYKGEEKCPHKEVMGKIVEEIKNADALIITSPVYSMQISGLLKNFIDHMSYNFHRPSLFTKKGLVITTTAGAGHKDAANYVKSVLNYWGLNYIQTLPIAYRSMELTEKNKTKVLKSAKKFSKELNFKNLHKPSFKSVVMFNLWKAMSKEKYEEGSADYDYWHSEEMSSGAFSPQVPIGVFKRVVGKTIYKMMS